MFHSIDVSIWALHCIRSRAWDPRHLVPKEQGKQLAVRHVGEESVEAGVIRGLVRDEEPRHRGMQKRFFVYVISKEERCHGTNCRSGAVA